MWVALGNQPSPFWPARILLPCADTAPSQQSVPGLSKPQLCYPMARRAESSEPSTAERAGRNHAHEEPLWPAGTQGMHTPPTDINKKYPNPVLGL